MTHALIPRRLHSLLDAALGDTPALRVNGPRQRGKTMLERQRTEPFDQGAQASFPRCRAAGQPGAPDAGTDRAGFKGLRRLAALCPERFRAGAVLYDGEHVLPFGDGFYAVPLHHL